MSAERTRKYGDCSRPQKHFRLADEFPQIKYSLSSYELPIKRIPRHEYFFGSKTSSKLDDPKTGYQWHDQVKILKILWSRLGKLKLSTGNCITLIQSSSVTYIDIVFIFVVNRALLCQKTEKKMSNEKTFNTIACASLYRITNHKEILISWSVAKKKRISKEIES